MYATILWSSGFSIVIIPPKLSGDEITSAAICGASLTNPRIEGSIFSTDTPNMSSSVTLTGSDRLEGFSASIVAIDFATSGLILYFSANTSGDKDPNCNSITSVIDADANASASAMPERNLRTSSVARILRTDESVVKLPAISLVTTLLDRAKLIYI